MIRTGIVNLTIMPAVAYRQRLSSGDVGIVIVSRDTKQPGIASISKTSGEAILTDNTPSVYTKEAFKEAINLTEGMPYKKLGNVKYVEKKLEEIEDEDSQNMPEDVIVSSDEYIAIVSNYTDKNGKLSYNLINRDMIQLAHRSEKVQKMIASMASEEEIRQYVTGVKFRELTDNHNLSDAQVKKIIEMLNEVSPRGVMKEFNDEIRIKLGASKRKNN